MMRTRAAVAVEADKPLEIMEVNLDGTFLPVMALKDGMLKRGFGRIVCIASIAGLRPRPNNIA